MRDRNCYGTVRHAVLAPGQPRDCFTSRETAEVLRGRCGILASVDYQPPLDAANGTIWHFHNDIGQAGTGHVLPLLGALRPAVCLAAWRRRLFEY